MFDPQVKSRCKQATIGKQELSSETGQVSQCCCHFLYYVKKKFFLSAAQEKNISCFFRSNPSRCFDDLTDSCENNSLVRHRRA